VGGTAVGTGVNNAVVYVAIVGTSVKRPRSSFLPLTTL